MSYNKIGVIYFSNDESVYLYDNFEIDGISFDDPLLELSYYLENQNKQFFVLLSGSKRYIINKDKILFIKEIIK